MEKKIDLSKLEAQRVEAYLNPSHFERGLVRHNGLETNRRLSTGGLSEIHTISPSSERYVAASPYVNTR